MNEMREKVQQFLQQMRERCEQLLAELGDQIKSTSTKELRQQRLVRESSYIQQILVETRQDAHVIPNTNTQPSVRFDSPGCCWLCVQRSNDFGEEIDEIKVGWNTGVRRKRRDGTWGALAFPRTCQFHAEALQVWAETFSSKKDGK